MNMARAISTDGKKVEKQRKNLGEDMTRDKEDSYVINENNEQDWTEE